MPMENTILYKKLASLPENLKAQVADFIDFLLHKNKQSGSSKKPKFGSGKGMFKIKPGFNDPLEDFKDYTH
jgi:hypothetical protein